MPRIAKIVVDIALDREFDYVVPDALSERIAIGSRILVPFGKSKCAGYVVAFLDHSDRSGLKSILSLITDKPFIDQSILDLARWIADYYCAPVEHAIRTVLPGAVRRKKAQFKKQFYVCLAGCSDDPNNMGVKIETRGMRTSVATSLPLSEQAVGQKNPSKMTIKQAAILELLRVKKGMLLSELLADAHTTIAPVRALERKGLVRIETTSIRRDPLANREILRTTPLELMPQQSAALALIKECIDAESPAKNPEQIGAGIQRHNQNVEAAPLPAPDVAKAAEQSISSRTVLLYGVTGSGKTEVYLQAIDHVLTKGKGAIVLVPEISLTPQTVERFAGRFGDRIAVLHSHLSDGERHDEWHRIHDGKADIVIGARSAVFAPVHNLGLIVVDEEHEPSYKQEESPRYNARDVAVMRGLMDGCAVVLGSATPALESWMNTKTGKYRLAVLPHRADNRKMPVMRIVDMRVETARKGHPDIFSQDLIEAIRLRLDRAEQTILFLNRRGYATSLVCPKCGFVAGCDQCSVSFTYHRTVEQLHCHICGATKAVPRSCPGCHDPAFRYSGMGTQRVEDIVKKCFPRARVQRMDADVTTRKDSYDRILGDFRVGKIDILIGTQMIAKGLHFPNVTLVGVVYADLSLHMPDFRAGERTFQLLAQVAGRAGRGETPGEVIVQTYTPFHPAVQAVRRLDYAGFCDQELAFRREMKYPPCSHLICLTMKGPSQEKVAFYCSALAKHVRNDLLQKAIVSDASPAPISRAKGKYRFQIMLRSGSMRTVTHRLKDVLRNFKLPGELDCAVDVDALSLL